MDHSSVIRSLLVGNTYIHTNLEYKRAMLRGYMASIGIVVGIAYCLLDFRSGLMGAFPYYVIVVALSLLTIILNRKQHFQSANFLFLITFNLIIFLFAASDVQRTGMHMFFVCISISAFALFGATKFRYAFFFSGVSLTLFILTYLVNFSISSAMVFNESYISISTFINFLIALVTCVIIVYSLIAMNDHSERELMHTANELRKSRERNDMVIEAVNAGIYEWRTGEKTIFISTTWKKLLGYEAHELRDIDFDFYYSIIHPDDYALVQQVMNTHLKDKKPYSNETRLFTKEGEYRWFLDSGHTKFDEQGQHLITVGSIIDIHERKKTEDKIWRQNELLTKTNKELDQFVYSVSHDLRAPLSSILGLTNIYNLSSTQEEKESIVKMINGRTITLDNFIAEILDYSRNARTEIKTQRVKILEVVSEVLTALSYMNGLDKVKVEIQIDAALEIKTDRQRLKIILNNLIGNAVKYSDPAKESFIHIHSRKQDNQVSITIKDNGIGIQPEHQGKIFDMFYQAHEQANGSGLGLYIVSEAIQRLNGKVSVQSAYTQGSTFIVALPSKP